MDLPPAPLVNVLLSLYQSEAKISISVSIVHSAK